MALAWYFTPPTRFRRPPVRVDTPERDRKPAIFFSSPDGLIAQGVNVFVLNDGSYSEIQPPLYSEFTSIYLGGHYNGPLTDAEIASLTAAGYGPNLVQVDLGDVVPVGGGFGGGSYGEGGYGE